MREIVQVVNLVSDTGAFGGPSSVAVSQLRELQRQGHSVRLLALWVGTAEPPSTLEGVPLTARRAQTFIPGFGMLGLFNLGFLRDVYRAAGSARVMHIHAGRDLASLAALAVAVARRRPFVAQTHGMVDRRTFAVARVFDSVFLRLLRRARRCLVLTPAEERMLRAALGDETPPLTTLPNGVEVPEGRPPSEDEVAGPPTVLFLSRMHWEKGPDIFVRAATIVRETVPDAQFVLHGPDGGVLDQAIALIDELDLGGTVSYGGPLAHEDAIRVMQQATVFVLPSTNEVFPMALLEAMAAGTASVCTDLCDISRELLASGAAVVTTRDSESVAKAVIELLEDEDLRTKVAEMGRETVMRSFSASAVARQLTEIYAEADAPGARGSAQ